MVSELPECLERSDNPDIPGGWRLQAHYFHYSAQLFACARAYLCKNAL